MCELLKVANARIHHANRTLLIFINEYILR